MATSVPRPPVPTVPTPPTEPATRSISENLEALKSWMTQADSTASLATSVMSHAKTCIFIGTPVLFIGGLGYLLTRAATSGTEAHCVCPDGGVRKTMSKRRMAA